VETRIGELLWIGLKKNLTYNKSYVCSDLELNDSWSTMRWPSSKLNYYYFTQILTVDFIRKFASQLL